MSFVHNNHHHYIRLLDDEGNNYTTSNRLPVDSNATLSGSGQEAVNDSVSVVLASLHPNINVDDTTAQTTLSTINGKVPSLGQSNKLGSVPVTVASDQDALDVSDTTAQNTLSAISGKLPSALGQTDKDNSMSVCLASDQDALSVIDAGQVAELEAMNAKMEALSDKYVNEDAWSAASTGANGKSSSMDCQYASHVSVFGNVNGATDLSIEISNDNSNWYATEETYSLSGSGNFAWLVQHPIGARYVRLNSTNDVTATIVMTAKQ